MDTVHLIMADMDRVLGKPYTAREAFRAFKNSEVEMGFSDLSTSTLFGLNAKMQYSIAGGSRFGTVTFNAMLTKLAQSDAVPAGMQVHHLDKSVSHAKFHDLLSTANSAQMNRTYTTVDDIDKQDYNCPKICVSQGEGDHKKYYIAELSINTVNNLDDVVRSMQDEAIFGTLDTDAP